MSQPARFATLEKFKQNELRLLVCSDVAARGIDIGGLSHVFNFDVPHHAEDYVHRIGRTGRAGLKGHAFTLCSPEDKLAIEAIEKLTAGPILRIVVPGLDVVEWAEGDSRKRRGRGGKPSGEKPRGKSAEAPAEETSQPRRGRGGRPEGRARQPDRAPKPEAEIAAAEPQPAARPSRPAPRAEPARPEPRFDRPQNRDQSRDYRRRDEDLGPAVQGFGDDIPAFMTLPRRADRPLASLGEDQDN
jgi:superfamily II DNA/RNA helicase